MSTTETEPAKASVHLLSCSELVRLQEARRETRNGPQPWIFRKLTVGIVVLIVGWVTYVYVGRVCVRVIRRDDGVVGSRALGITLVVLFSLLWFFFVWSYAKIVFTPPGFARDHIPKSPRPGAPTFGTPPPRRLEPADISYSQRSTSSYPPIPRTPKPSDWSSSDDGWGPSAVANESRHGMYSYTTGEQERDPGAGREPSLSSPDSAAAQQSREGDQLDRMEAYDTEGRSGKRYGSTRTARPSSTGSPPPGMNNSTTRNPPAPTPLSPIDSTGSNPYPHPHHPSHIITSAVSMQTGTTLIHQGSTNNNDTDVPDRHDYPGEAEDDTDAKARANAASPAPSPDSRTPSSRPRSPPPQLFPERANKDQSSTEAPADRPPSATYAPSSPAAPRASHQQEQNDSFQRVHGRHVPSREAMGAQSEDDLPPPLYSRRPPTAPVLDEEYRYCPRDELIKPYRTHHCRTCGTCVLYYDHHCPWIGQCVGARNRKFFVNFLIWCVAFTTYVIATLLPIVVIIGNRTAAGGDLIDGQVVGVIAVAIVFLLFSSTLLFTHIHLLLHNASTVEWYGFQRMRQRERVLLGEMFPPCVGGPCGDRRDHPFGEYRETVDKNSDEGSNNWCCRPNPSAHRDKKRTRKAWDAEWGRIGKEGNLWWVDASTDDPHSQQISGKRRQWEQVMGHSVWEWLLPIGDTKQKGLDYRPNPRFDINGRWRKRRQWPAGLT